MKKTKVHLKERSYEIMTGSGVLSELPRVLAEISETAPVVVITDRNVITGSGHLLSGVLKKVANPIVKIVLKPGESSKSLGVFESTIKKIVASTKLHKPIVVAVGGGVVGDLAGFVASAYRRGVPLVQVPTTLLAQVDSSVGGKVGVDLLEAKNIIGAFYQPTVVLADTRFLNSLPPRQIRNGMAEVIKYAVIKSSEMFELLEENIEKAVALEGTLMGNIVSRCVSIKSEVVAKDEFDCKDVRIILNFGHTLGHAVETASGYSDLYNHGESISLGMLMAGEISAELGFFKRGPLVRMERLLAATGLPVALKGLSVQKVVKACRYDKKFTSGVNRFVVPLSIGKVKVVEDVPSDIIQKAVKKFTCPGIAKRGKKR